LEEIEANAGARPPLTDQLASIRNNVRDLVDEPRHICGSLRPPTIDSLGLGPVLQSYTRDWSERTGIPADLDLDPQLGRLLETIEPSIFRVVREGLSNVQRHANARTVQISLRHSSPRPLMLSIVDNGVGLGDDFELTALPVEGRYGLLGISERVASLGGRSRFQNQAGCGLLVQAEIPHPRVAQLRQPGTWQRVLCGFLGMEVNSTRPSFPWTATMVVWPLLCAAERLKSHLQTEGGSD
jgi:signal transduction histidine kinase